jgi:phosphoribosylanthranilate isomerase
MRVRVKICGITTDEAVDAAAASGVDAVGFVFAASPRRIGAHMARRLAARLPSSVARVAVFHRPTLADLLAVIETFEPDLVQLEPDTALLRASPRPLALLPVVHDGAHVVDEARRMRETYGGPVLLEPAGPGGRGVAPDWERARRIAAEGPLVLAGGLGVENVGDAIRRVRPHGVDVSSGVESRPGVKDPGRIAAFVAAVRRAEIELLETEDAR